MSNSVLAIVISFNDGPALMATVTALLPQVEKLVVIDNGSNDATLDCIEKLKNNFGIFSVCLHENSGIGAALNIGVSIALKENFTWILTMDQDSIASPKMVSEMLICAKNRHDAGVICPSWSVIRSKKEYGDCVVSSAITSGNLVRVDIFKIIGKYNESYFIDAVDFEFSLRVRNYGYKIVRCNSSVLHHKLGEVRIFFLFGYLYSYTSHSPLRRYYIYRNHMYLVSEFWYKNPVFIVKKSIISLIYLFELALFDARRFDNFKMIFKGIIDFWRSKKGVYE